MHFQFQVRRLSVTARRSWDEAVNAEERSKVAMEVRGGVEWNGMVEEGRSRSIDR